MGCVKIGILNVYEVRGVSRNLEVGVSGGVAGKIYFDHALQTFGNAGNRPY